MSVAILNASWASLKMCDEEWIFFWMDSNTVSSLRTSPARCKQNHQNEKSSQNTQRSIITVPDIAMQQYVLVIHTLFLETFHNYITYE